MTDKELVKGCIRQNAGCQRLLFEQYAGSMMTVCRRYAADQQEAEDILQSAFIRVFAYIHQYKFEGPLGAWITRVTVNAALTLLKTKKTPFLELGEQHQSFHSIDPDALSNLNEEELLRLISRLPEGYRLVFNLYVLEGYNHDEIGELLNIKPATSRSQLSKARRMLQEQITSSQKIVK